VSFTGNLLVFLGTVAAISVTGVMMPGPVTAAAIAKGYHHKWAGMHIALGHAVVEFPTIALMALGFSALLGHPYVSVIIGILGGAMLIFMGGSMIFSKGGVMEKLRQQKKEGAKASGDSGATTVKDPFPYHPFIAGIITTASNPYYIIWWATLGAALIANALQFGLLVLAVFAVLHWSIDLGWDVFLSYTVHRSRGLWNDRVYVGVFAACGAIMLAFGVWFAASAVVTVLSL